jgi:hypothetical protein
VERVHATILPSTSNCVAFFGPGLAYQCGLTSERCIYALANGSAASSLGSDWRCHFLYGRSHVALSLDKEPRSASAEKMERKPIGGQSDTKSLAHSLHLPGSGGIHVGVDKTKKTIQIGFKLQNSSEIPLRYSVKDATSAVEGRVSMAQNFSNKGGVVAKNNTNTFLCVPIPFSLPKKGAEATASIVYQYGPADPDIPPSREARYRVGISIGPTGSSAYVFDEEDDVAI